MNRTLLFLLFILAMEVLAFLGMLAGGLYVY